jgi:hypothetical protein
MTNANRRKEIFSKYASPYLSQKKAWSATKKILEYWEHAFLPFIYSWTGDPVLLILNNCGPHGAELIDPRGQSVDDDDFNILESIEVFNHEVRHV